VNSIGLSIGGLNIRLGSTRGWVRRVVADIFSPFLGNSKEEPQETLQVLPAKTRRRCSPGDFEPLIKESLRIPLSRFPFVSDEKWRMRYLLRRTLPFLYEEEFRKFLSHVQGAQDLTLLPFASSLLCRRDGGGEHRSALFLKTWSRKKTKVASIYGSVYFVSAVGLPSVEGLLMHGVGIVEQECGLLFLGLAGDGKSTLARLSRPRKVISDDGIIVTHRGGVYELHPTPFNQHETDVLTPDERRPQLVMGFFLKKDEQVRIEKVSPLEACPIILKHHIHYFRYFPPEVAEQSFLLAADLCRTVPFYRLHFRKEPTFWPLVESALAESS
jgi:hypothetical protein